MRASLLLAVILAALISTPAAAQPTSTRCQTVAVPITDLVVDLRLIGCGDGFEKNTLWHLDRADSPSGQLDTMFVRQFTGKGALVYVWDTGIKPDHDEFVRPEGTNVIDGIDLLTPVGIKPACSPLPSGPCQGDIRTNGLFLTHGTAVASIVAGRTTGIAPDAKLVSVLAVSTHVSGGQLPPDFVLQGLDRIIRHAWEPSTPAFQTAIVNISGLPFGRFDAMAERVEAKMRDMIAGVDAEGRRDPAGKRFLFVSIAGNYIPIAPGSTAATHGQCDRNRRTVGFPSSRGSAVDGLIVVGGITADNRVWEMSCIGESVDILAPAADMLVASFLARDQYRSGHLVEDSPSSPPRPMNSGTSYAAPYVSGLAALLLEQNPSLTPEHLELIIKSTPSRVVDANEPTAGGRVAIVQVLEKLPRRRAAAR